MDKAQLNQLKALRDEALQSAAKDILEARYDSAYENIRRMECAGRIMKDLASQKKLNPRITFAVIAVVSLILIGILLDVRIPKTAIVLDLETTGIEFQLAEDFHWEDRLHLVTERIRLEHFARVQLPFPDIDASTLTEHSSLTINGGKAVLDRLSFKENGLVTINNNTDQSLDILLGQAPCEGHLQLSGQPRLSIANEQDSLIWDDRLGPWELPETLYFGTTGAGIVKSVLRIKTSEQMVFIDLRISRLVFSRRSHDGAGTRFVSTVEGGTLYLSDIDRRRELINGDRLSLEALSGSITRLSVGTKTKIRFEGTAEKIITGPAGHDLELTPTLLEYTKQNQRIALLSGAIAMIWGILWGAKRMLFP